VDEDYGLHPHDHQRDQSDPLTTACTATEGDQDVLHGTGTTEL